MFDIGEILKTDIVWLSQHIPPKSLTNAILSGISIRVGVETACTIFFKWTGWIQKINNCFIKKTRIYS